MESIFGDYLNPKNNLEQSKDKARIVAIENHLAALESRSYIHGKSLEKINQILKDMGNALNRLIKWKLFFLGQDK